MAVCAQYEIDIAFNTKQPFKLVRIYSYFHLIFALCSLRKMENYIKLKVYFFILLLVLLSK